MAMANKARDLAKEGKDVVSLTVGEPDWPTASAANEAGIAAIKEGFTKYTAAAGMPELRKALAKVISEETGVSYADSQVVVGAGAKYVIFGALQMLLDPGQEVLIPSPYWVSYPTMVELAGGKPVILECPESQNFKLTPAQLEKAITPQTKILILCSPSNPTGILYTRDELAALAKVLAKFPNLIVLSDDIYNRLLFSDEKVAPHLLHVAPELKNRMVVVNGASKSFSMTGWRIGWAACPDVLAKVLGDFFSQSTSNVSSITQKATLKALENPDPEIAKARRLLRARWDMMKKGLAKVPGVRVIDAQGAFYVWLNVKGWIGKTHKPTGKKITDSAALGDLLLEQELVATVPGVEFGAEGYLRLSFACSETQLQKAIDRFVHFSSNLA
jgi:aspartate aminotransferase